MFLKFHEICLTCLIDAIRYSHPIDYFKLQSLAGTAQASMQRLRNAYPQYCDPVLEQFTVSIFCSYISLVVLTFLCQSISRSACCNCLDSSRPQASLRLTTLDGVISGSSEFCFSLSQVKASVWVALVVLTFRLRR